MTDTNPTVRRRRLAGELIRLRVSSGKTREQVAELLDCHVAKISRIETGRSGVRVSDLRKMLEFYGATGDDVEALVALTQQAGQRGWWQPFSDVLPQGFDAYVAFEQVAQKVATFQALLVPGLLQTEAYAHAVSQAWWPTTGPGEMEQRIRVRLERQQILTRGDDAPLVWAVLDEAVLRREIGSNETRREQLRRLLEVGELPNVEVQVIPFSSGPHASLDGAFGILTFPDARDQAVVHLETLVGSLFLEETREVDRYSLVFDHLRASALGRPETTALIEQMIRELE